MQIIIPMAGRGDRFVRAGYKDIKPLIPSALAASSFIREDSPVCLSYCDFSLSWNYSQFLGYLRATGCDGCIPSYRGFHPHSLGSNLYG